MAATDISSQIFVIILSCSMVAGLVLNSLLICFLYRRYRRLPCDKFYVSLAVSDVILLLLSAFDIVSIGQQRIMFETGVYCTYLGFAYTSIGLVSITHLFVLTLLRIGSLVLPIPVRTFFQMRYGIIGTLIGCWLNGFVWGLMPLFGWSAYVLDETTSLTCTLSWGDVTLSSKSFIGSLLFFCFILPVMVLLVSIGLFVWYSSSYSRMQLTLDRSHKSSHYRSLRYAWTTMMVFLSFIICWTPYATIGFLNLLKANKTPQTLSLACTVLAKTSPCFHAAMFSYCDACCRSFVVRVLRMITSCFQNGCITELIDSDISHNSVLTPKVSMDMLRTSKQYLTSTLTMREEPVYKYAETCL